MHFAWYISGTKETLLINYQSACSATVTVHSCTYKLKKNINRLKKSIWQLNRPYIRTESITVLGRKESLVMFDRAITHTAPATHTDQI